MTRRPLVLAASTAALLALATPAVAQIWQGVEGVGVRVREGRKPVAGAEVLLRYADVEPIDGPPAVRTGEDGRVVIRGLAPGRWRVDVGKEGFSSYLLVVALDPGGESRIISGPVRDATGDRLRIDLFEVESAPAPPPPPRRPERPEPPPEPPPERVPARSEPDETPAPPVRPEPAPKPEPSEPPAPPVRPEPEPAPMEPEPPREPAPAEEPAPPPPAEAAPEPTAPPAPPEPEPVTAEPEAAPEPEPEPMEPEGTAPPAEPEPAPMEPEPGAEPEPEPAPGPMEPEPAPPEPEPETPAATPPEPPPSAPPAPAEPPRRPAPSPPPAAATPPAAAPPAEPPPLPFISAARRSSTDDTCPECKPGEAALTLEQLVGSTGSAPPSAAACASDLAARLDRIAALLAEAGVSEVAPLLSGQGGAIQRLQGTPAAEETATLVTPLLRRDAVCQTLIAVLPPGAEYTGYSYEASDAFSSGPCAAGEECAIGSASFLGEPTLVHTAGPTLVYGVFHNQSQGRQRRARMTIYYSP